MGMTAIDPAISVIQSRVKIQPPQLTGNPRSSTTQNITDPNTSHVGGHLDEINPSQSNFFNGLDEDPRGKYYNTSHRRDPQIPAYDANRDSWGDSYNLAKSIDPKTAEKECI